MIFGTKWDTTLKSVPLKPDVILLANNQTQVEVSLLFPLPLTPFLAVSLKTNAAEKGCWLSIKHYNAVCLRGLFLGHYYVFYINGIANVASVVSLLMFAVNIALFLSHSNLN